MADNIPPIPIICGPTGSGKTSVAVKLAQSVPIEIISADSRQIIKYLNIGTAKPTPDEQKQVRFHLIDIIEPGERYSAFQFIDDATAAIKDIINRGKLPVVVGGTGLYLHALSEGVVEIEQEDMEIRERLEKEADEIGLENMFNTLKEIDPLEAAKIHPNNKTRVIRALEMYHLTGKTKTELINSSAYKKPEFNFEYFCLTPERQSLYNIINQRVETMLADGWLEEIKVLIDDGHSQPLRQANVIGYKELLDYIDGVLTYDQAVSLIKQNTRRYAKRQFTWFRNKVDTNPVLNPEALYNLMKEKVIPKFVKAKIIKLDT